MGINGAQQVDMKLEAIVIPVADIDRTKRFYADLGWRFDGDYVAGDSFRGVQFTPPGSCCSIQFGKGITSAAPGTAQGMYLVVSDIVAARAALVSHGVDVSEVFHRSGVGTPPEPGVDPARRSYSSFATFKDPDGNSWLLQEVTARLPGRVEGETTFTSSSELASTLRRASVAHGEHEKRAGGARDEEWPTWYAEYIVREQAGQPLPQ